MKIKKIGIMLTFISCISFFGCGKVPEPKFNIKPGIYNKEIEVEITNYKKYASILYNLDGKNPSQNVLMSAVKQDGTKTYKGEKFKVKMNEKLEIRYLAFQRGKNPSEVKKVIYQVLKRCQKPKLEIVNNIVFFNNSEQSEKIFFSLDNSKFVEGKFIQLNYGKHKIKAFSSKEKYQNSEIIEQNINIDNEQKLIQVNINEPEIKINKNEVSIICNADEVWYQLENGAWNKYEKPLTLQLGSYSINAYGKRKVGNKYISSNQLNSKLDITEINYVGETNNYTFQSSYTPSYSNDEIKEEIKEPPKGQLITTKIQIASYATMFNFKNALYVIEGQKIEKIVDKKIIKKIEIGKEIEDFTIFNNNIYLLLNSKITVLNSELLVLNEINLEDSFTRIDVNKSCIYVANERKIVTYGNKGNNIQIDLPNNSITRITGLKDGVIVGEKKGAYNNIISFVFDSNSKKYYEISNSKNEYCIGFSSKSLYTIVDRNTLNAYNEQKKYFSRTFDFDVIVNNLIKNGDEIVLLGTNKADEMVVIKIQGNSVKYHKEKSIVPMTIRKYGNKYIVDGVKNDNYCQVILDNYLIQN